ncbi:uncharacterized protein TNIN_359901 [Trichonephila inaurata madagascariensis]|uniref:Uncharacterized protein n=1 Tax=Trichonephila inaurata madagascariensis TaxID=2747483 RepID=A0A8X6Y4T0_9ARAC|nr:uncharacterized protein TNIN_359901 [Trichonephila inaurata madagascariensis]
MELPNRLKSTLKGKISRIETLIESANEETDSVEIEVTLKKVIALQRNTDDLWNNYYAIPNVEDAELAATDKDLYLLEERLESLSFISGKYEEFSSCKVQFDDLITNNTQLSQSQKLYYHRSCLTHEVS